MESTFSPFDVLEKAANSHYTGQLIINNQDITWILDLSAGNLKSAVHSLQSLASIELCLYSLGYGQKTPIMIEGMTQQGLNLEKGESFIGKAISWLTKEYNLSILEQIKIINQLTQDALESFFALTKADYHTSQNKSLVVSSEQGFNVRRVLKFWRTQKQAWQKFSPLISSPHQRPYCPNLDVVKKISTSKYSHLLLKIAQLKGKASIRQLSILMKLDDYQVAEFIYPYLRSKVLQLHAPLPPFDQLPELSPSSQYLKVKNPSLKGLKKSSTLSKTQETKEINKSYKIVCIDDSETVLNTFKRYLTSEKTELFMLSNPTLAINKLFEIKPDLLLVDIAMPGINGDKLSKILKRSSAFQNLPIIIVSADTNKIKDAKAKGNVANDFLSKPFSQDDLISIINKHLKLEKESCVET
ncbi:response regulator [Crocosphaera chwakensis]|uniref:Response regulator receiver domain protein (CheY-like) n=1 Tax=Crocosphaera chwakensis CCY0110 TaxID=391612 RepID=A3IQC4_9CHRO|nr:response regulator [Crocosphaera chwakensis]EAZ91464.1 response regulator receiver domain protein (CheY-like) [Crocosphaera chwakensis CCY0110]